MHQFLTRACRVESGSTGHDRFSSNSLQAGCGGAKWISRFCAFVVAAAVALANASAAERQVLSGHIPAAVTNLQPVGRLPGAETLSLAIGLPLRNQEAFETLLRQIYDPASPNYRHYLTPQQIADRFGPSPQDYATAIVFMQSNGLAVTRTHSDRTLLRVQGSVSQIEKAFHVNLLVYSHPTESRTFYAPDVEPSVEISTPLLHISGLSDYARPSPGGHRGSKLAANASPGSGSGPGGAYMGSDYRSAYLPGVSLTGAGQSIGLLELDGYYTNDIIAYEKSNGLPNVRITNVLVDGASGSPDANNNWVGEVSLDMEMAIAMAPGITNLLVYESANCCYYWVDILKQMQEDNAAKQLSCSWLFDYDDPSAEPIYQEFAMQGQSFFQCSGDDLAFYSGVSQWTDDANVTLVGGTQLTTTGPHGAWVSETTWNNGDGSTGSGGGISGGFMGNFSIPSWQQGISMVANGGSTTKRNVPDVALVGYYAWVIWDNGSTDWWWGTSISAPLWAGFTALVNQQAAAKKQAPVGFLNPALYAIGKSSLYASCFHDITTGNNTNSYSAGLYHAVAGYDLCTGWGTPRGSNLINALSLNLPITMQVSRTNSQVTLSWNAIPGQAYQVQYLTNLKSTHWLMLTNIVATNSPVSENDTIARSGQRYYRAVLVP